MDQAKLDHIEWAVDCLKSRMDAEERERADAPIDRDKLRQEEENLDTLRKAAKKDPDQYGLAYKRQQEYVERLKART